MLSHYQRGVVSTTGVTNKQLPPQVGDIVGATYCVGQAEMFDVLMGQSLHKVEETLRYSWDRIAELDQGMCI